MSDDWNAWDQYTSAKADIVEGGDWPEIPDDIYDAQIMDVSGPKTERNRYYNPETDSEDKEFRTTFSIKFELLDEMFEQQTWLYKWVPLSKSFLESGGRKIHKNSALREVMEDLGIDPDGEGVAHDPRTWVGMPCRVTVANKAPDGGGEVRPRITALAKAKQQRPKREPVAAGRGRFQDVDD